ncbi:MAG: hybrid sensor histidine kinase/response regulator, partial [Burkholderiales bacterium PBB5]
MDPTPWQLRDVPVAWLDAQGGLLGMNAAFERALGCSATDHLGQPLSSLLGLSVEPDEVRQALQTGHEFSQLPLRGRGPDGRPLAGRIGQHCQTGLRVVTWQVEAPAVTAETAPAQEASDRLQLALTQRLEMATAAAGVGVWSAELGDPGLVRWDEQMRALHSLPPGAPAPSMREYLVRHVHEADRATLSEHMAVLLRRSEGLLDMDLRILNPDGTIRRLATRSAISTVNGHRHLHGVMLDVTARHATEERLRQATERAALAARGAGIGTWESDADGISGWWDEQMFRLRGIDRPAGLVQGPDMAVWLHPDDRAGHGRQMHAALTADGPTNTEFRVVWPDGTVRWLASRSTPVRDETGRTHARIGINWDITDARNAAAARQERLLAQRESQAKSRFLARISHELRTPLNAVLGFSQLLLAENPPGAAPDPTTWRSRVQHVQASGEHLLALIDDVLELSSLDSGELRLSLQPVPLAPLVATTLPLVDWQARAHGVTLALGAIEGCALADPVRLRQVLLNLLSNGIKYNQSGGRVTVSAEADGSWIKLRVQDTGRGLTPSQLRHLFEPFNRLGA